MCFTWYRKVSHLGHLWGTSGQKSLFLPARLRASMHRLHWYPTEGSAVAHADVAQSLGHVVGVAQLLMCFTWYRKVLHLGHLWGTFE